MILQIGGVVMSLSLASTVRLQKIESVYQPMWNIYNKEIFGYEALLRFPDGFCGGNIEKAFELARNEGVLYELDTRAISNAVSNFPLHLLNMGLLLFINIYPSTLIHPHFDLFLNHLMKKYPQIEGKIVFELSESEQEVASWTLSKLKEKILMIKEKGFLTALDDVGKGVAGLQKMIEFCPDYLKLDRFFSKELSKSKEKQEMISLLLHYSRQKMEVILEGIEEEMDLEQARILNVPIAQGYLLGKPEKLTARNVIRSFYTPANGWVSSQLL
jgi:EAL domain-containing protein (putative c-di-GMP-specific phosphodiesterase class I)